LIDLDETLIRKHSFDLQPKVISWISQAKSQGFRICLISNNFNPHRTKELSELMGVPYLPTAYKPLPFGFHKALNILELPPKKIAVIGDQLFTDVLGGKWYGLHTILVRPMNQETFWMRQAMRQAEALVLKDIVKDW
jgi:uncharacterized protein